MASSEEIAAKVIKVLAETLHREPKTIQLSSSLSDDLEMDSFMAIEMLFQLEDQYGIEIPDEQIQAFKTVADIVEYLEKRLGGE
ncbi:MAG: acyl carrier protein [Desulfobacteraceae bacterium]|nr:MAG: acyl carrier protein [Desulfobacteraceae bacterium]